MTSNTGNSGLVRTLEEQVNESDTSAFEVGDQRERNHRFYSLQPMGNEQPGRSQYVSPDVMDAVESQKAIFSESFLSARDAVKFTNCPYPNEAEAKTAYVNRALKRNSYEALFRDAWHDAFVAKRCVFLAEWRQDSKQVELSFEGTPAPAVNQQLQQLGNIIDIDDTQIQMQQMQSPQGPMQIVSGQLDVTVDDSFVHLMTVTPEQFYRDPEATYVQDSMWCTVEEEVSRGQLIDWGYDPDQVSNLSQEYRFRSSSEDSARKRHDSSWTRRQQNKRTPSQESVTFYRTWTWLDGENDVFSGTDYEPEPGFKLYEIHWSQGEILGWAAQEAEEGAEQEGATPAIRVAQEMPFFEWAEMKVSHAEHGMCTADVLAHTQKVQSGLKRLVYDNQQMRNSSRTMALSGALKNPRDLLDNKIGATIWTSRMDAVAPLPAPELSPLTMNVIGMFKADGEERSGMSSLAKGMETNALKYQNADNMIERLTNAGTRRVTAKARDFATTCLIPLSQYIAKLGKRNDKSTDMMEIAGQQVQIAPGQWQDDAYTMDVAVALTPDEGQALGQQLMGMHSTLSQDPSMAIAYGAEQKHALLDTVFDLMGVSDTTRFMLAPSDPQYQQKEQQAQQMAQMEQQKAEQKQERMLQFDMGLKKSADKLGWEQFQWQQTDDLHDNTLDDEKQLWQQEKDKAEFQLEKSQERAVSLD